MTVCIFGSSRPGPSEQAYRDAYEIGRLIAQQGWTVCNGGYGGIMRASSEGAKAVGGRTVGVTCRVFSRSGANEFIDEEIKTDSLMERLKSLIELGDAYVILPGGSGTLVEFSFVWELMSKKLMRKNPIVLFSEFWRPVAEITATDRPESLKLLRFVSKVEDVIEAIKGF